MDSYFNNNEKQKKPKINSEQKQSGAILFAVVGGKMSEGKKSHEIYWTYLITIFVWVILGINFSDDLGRCVIVVGTQIIEIFFIFLKRIILL